MTGNNTLNRRAFLGNSAGICGPAALGSLLFEDISGAPLLKQASPPAKAKRVISLFQSGGPSQMDLFDPKPQINPLSPPCIPPKFVLHCLSARSKFLAVSTKMATLSARVAASFSKPASIHSSEKTPRF